MFALGLLLAIAGVAAEGAGGSKFAQLVADHVFGHVNGDELVAVVDCKGVSNEFGGNHGSTAPGLDYRLLAAFLHGANFLFELNADEGAFF